MAHVKDEVAVGHINNSIDALGDRIALAAIGKTSGIAYIRTANKRYLILDKGLAQLGKALHRPFTITIDSIGTGIATQEDLVER